MNPKLKPDFELTVNRKPGFGQS